MDPNQDNLVHLNIVVQVEAPENESNSDDVVPRIILAAKFSTKPDRLMKTYSIFIVKFNVAISSLLARVRPHLSKSEVQV